MAEKPLLYVTPQTRSGTVQVMDAELGGVCDYQTIDVRAGEGRSPGYLTLNPMGKVPSMTYRGVTVTEAAAICAALADWFPEKELAPATDEPLRGAYYRWLFFSPSVIEPMMLDKLSGYDRPNATTAGHGDYARVMSAINSALGDGPWLLGENYSAADVVFGSTLRFATLFGAIPREGAVADYLDRIMERPAFQKTAAGS
ncbi:MAG: glutathione S-transferase C-terminal domain-containing protein [Pseudomonadota bacterium]